MIQECLTKARSLYMPLYLTCEYCKKEFVTRKRGDRIIRFCSRSCPIKSHWVLVHERWNSASRESFIEEFKKSFEAFFDKSEGCWLWKGSNKGKKMPYGTIRFRGSRMIMAHRASWTIYIGEIPKGLLVLHKCDVPSCVNPDHLFLGTHIDNERDKLAKGRHSGEKLNPDKVREIKSLMASNFGDMKISRKYGISRQTTYSIRKGKTWKDII